MSPMMEDALLLGGSVDIVIDTVGNTSSLSTAIRLIKYKGTIILVGLPAMMAIDWTPLIAKETTIIPSITYSYDIINGKKQRTFQAALDLLASGRLSVKEFLTHKFSIDQYKEALEITANKKENEVKVKR
ncbi:unnamed protein product, partial [marine sediment metagenome]